MYTKYKAKKLLELKYELLLLFLGLPFWNVGQNNRGSDMDIDSDV